MDISVISPEFVNDAIAFGPDILNLLQIEIQSRKLSYQKIAERIHMANGTISSWFSRGAIPADKVFHVVSAVGGAKLWMEVLAKIPGNVFAAHYLDGTDENPVLVIADATDAAHELIELSQQVQRIIRHKQPGYQFSEEENAAIQRLEDAIADSIILGQMTLVRMEGYYHRDVRLTMKRQAERMEERGYKKTSSEASHRNRTH